MLCPFCHNQDLEENSIFCSSCGTRIIMKSNSINCLNLNYNARSGPLSTLSTNFDLAPETINQYKKLTQEIIEFQDVPKQLINSKFQLEILEIEYSKFVNDLTDLENQLKKEQNNVETSRSTTIPSLITKLKGTRDTTIEKEEKQYLVTKNKVNELEKEISDKKSTIQIKKNNISRLELSNQQLEENKKELNQLITQTTKKITNHPIEHLETELENFITNYNSLHAELNKYNQLITYLQSAESNLKFSIKSLKDTSGVAYRDLINYPSMNKAIVLLTSTIRDLNLALNIDSSNNEIMDCVDKVIYFQELFRGNGNSHYLVNDKISNSIDQFQTVLFKLSSIISKLNFSSSNIKQELVRSEKILDKQKKTIIEERKILFESAINQQIKK